MKVELLALCDFAADYGGKLNVIGVFDSLHAKQMPSVHPHCCIATKIRFDKFEEGAKKLTFTIADDDGKPVLPPMEVPIKVSMAPDAQTNSIQVVASISGLKLEAFGEYVIALSIDGRQEAEIPLFARRMS